MGKNTALGDIGNRLDIEDTERDIAHLKREIAGTFHKDTSQDRQIDALMVENAELKLYLASVIRLLTSKGTISTAELKALRNRKETQPDATATDQ